MLDEELCFNDPDLNDRCGLLNGRYEVYAATIPQCKMYKLVLSIDFAGSSPPPVMLHGAVPSTAACESAKRLAGVHRHIANPFWE